MSGNNRTRTEQRVFKWEEVKKLKRRQLYHLFVEAGLAGWDGVERQKKTHAHQRATNSRGVLKNLGICWECEAIFKKLKPPQEKLV